MRPIPTRTPLSAGNPSWSLCVGAALILSCAARSPGSGLLQQPSGYAADSAAIRGDIERGALGFMRADPDVILAHYARDIILSYPGIPDQGYSDLVSSYGELRSRPANVRAETTPTFDEIMVSGNLGVVRVRWTTTIRVTPTDSSPARETVRHLRDLQIWRREPAGEWRFIRGMHYRDSLAAPRTP